MDIYLIWWIGAVLLVCAELATGTLYLLMVALGLLAGGISAWLGHDFLTQCLITALLAGLGCWVVKQKSLGQPDRVESHRNRDVHIDLGNQVLVSAWHADGTAQVQYRGAVWSAVLDKSSAQASATMGMHQIVAMQGNRLVLQPNSTTVSE